MKQFLFQVIMIKKNNKNKIGSKKPTKNQQDTKVFRLLAKAVDKSKAILKDTPDTDFLVNFLNVLAETIYDAMITNMACGFPKITDKDIEKLKENLSETSDAEVLNCDEAEIIRIENDRKTRKH